MLLSESSASSSPLSLALSLSEDPPLFNRRSLPAPFPFSFLPSFNFCCRAVPRFFGSSSLTASDSISTSELFPPFFTRLVIFFFSFGASSSSVSVSAAFSALRFFGTGSAEDSEASPFLLPRCRVRLLPLRATNSSSSASSLPLGTKSSCSDAAGDAPSLEPPREMTSSFSEASISTTSSSLSAVSSFFLARPPFGESLAESLPLIKGEPFFDCFEALRVELSTVDGVQSCPSATDSGVPSTSGLTDLAGGGLIDEALRAFEPFPHVCALFAPVHALHRLLEDPGDLPNFCLPSSSVLREATLPPFSLVSSFIKSLELRESSEGCFFLRSRIPSLAGWSFDGRCSREGCFRGRPRPLFTSASSSLPSSSLTASLIASLEETASWQSSFLGRPAPGRLPPAPWPSSEACFLARRALSRFSEFREKSASPIAVFDLKVSCGEGGFSSKTTARISLVTKGSNFWSMTSRETLTPNFLITF
mmetsp:Transcript_73248/g.152930  ORF Transcript_73248/g.152930 Transcript_73248/m.152930 type:complete len:477 (+) Transcript_73248:826-2256(+)